MAPSGIKTLFAHRLFNGERWLRDVRIELTPAGKVEAVRTGSAARADLEMDVVLPGLVNAHVHLDLAPLATAERRFERWLRAVIASRRDAAPDATARSNLHEAIRCGATAFGDIDAFGFGRSALIARDVTSRAYAELLGFDVQGSAAVTRVQDALQPSCGPVSSGLSPHAPYSVSADLARAAAAAGAKLALHVAETEEEVRFVRDGDGPFRRLLEELDKWDPAFEPMGCSPIEWAQRVGCTGPDVLLIHANHQLPGDLEILARSGSPVVVCPGTIHWFERPPPPLAAMRRAGVVVAIGTDSLASNEELDMFREMRLLRGLCPEVDSVDVLRMATAEGGRALGLPVGRLVAGRRLDAVCFAAAPSRRENELTEWLTSGSPEDPLVLLGGSRCDEPRGSL